MLKLVLKYVVTSIVPAAVQIFGSRYLGTEGAAALGGTIALVGGRLLHTTNPPVK